MNANAPQNEASLTIPLPTGDLRKRIIIQLLALIAVSCLVVLAGISSERYMQNLMPENKTMPSVFNRKPSGVSGLLEIASKSGVSCKTWVLPYRQLNSIDGMLVIISPSESLAEFEAEQILSWVAKGNDLVYLDHFAYKMTRRLLEQIRIEAREGSDIVDSTVSVDSRMPEFAHVKDLTISANTRLVGAPALVSDSSGALFTEIKHGRGHILLGTVPSLVSNRRLSTASDWRNFQFFINCMHKTKGAVWFDERCHGFSQNGNVFVFLFRGAGGAVFLQLLGLLCLGVVSAAQRFGKTKKLEQKRLISNLEFVAGLSNAYKRAKANAAVLEIVGQTGKQKLCKILGVSPHEPTTALIEAWKVSPLSQRTPAIPVEQFLLDFEAALKAKSVSDNELKSLVITCDKITEQLKGLLTAPLVGGRPPADD